MSSNLLKLSLIVPLYNEETTAAKVIKKSAELRIPQVTFEIIVVDDGSTDTSLITIKKLKIKNVKYIVHKKNMGKGAAIRSGISKATGDYILIQDADLEYDPKQIKKLIQPVLKNKMYVVYGTRLKRLPNFSRDERTFRFFIHYLGNRLLSLITSVLYGQWITDMETGYKLISRKVVSSLMLSSTGFEIEAEITAKLLKKGYHILEVPITTNPRGYKEGKKLKTIRDGRKALVSIIKYKYIN